MTKALKKTPSLGVCEFSVVASAPASASEIFTYYERLRAYIEHEDGLINSRLTWSLTIHGFLFATYGILLAKVAEMFVDLVKLPAASLSLEYGIAGLFFLQIPFAVLGLAVSYHSREAIVGAHNSLQHIYAIAHASAALHIPPAKTSVVAAIPQGTQTVTPRSMSGIIANSKILVDNDSASAEAVTVTAANANTFTADFSVAHGAGVSLTPAGSMPLPKLVAGGADLQYTKTVSSYYLQLPYWLMAAWGLLLVASLTLGVLSLFAWWWCVLHLGKPVVGAPLVDMLAIIVLT